MGYAGQEVRPPLIGRCFLPGPVTGFYDLLQFTIPTVIAGATLPAYATLSGQCRVVGFGWAAHAVTGTDLTLLLGRESTLGGGITNMLQAASIDLDANLSGYIVDSSTSPTGLDGNSVDLNGDGTRWIRVAITSAATGTVTKFSAYLVVWHYGHPLADPLED